MTHLNILIADDRQDMCDSIEQNITVALSKYKNVNISENVVIKKIFTEHAYSHGCTIVREGFSPDICIFDLVFNGHTGIDLYTIVEQFNPNKNIYYCIYSGTETSFKKRKEADIIASQEGDNFIVVSKPHIHKVMKWLNKLLVDKYKMELKYEDYDPFDAL